MSQGVQSAVYRGMGIATISLSCLYFSARADEPSSKSTPNEPGQAVATIDSPMSAATRYVRAAFQVPKDIGTTKAGVSLEIGSMAKDALTRAASAWNRGAVAVEADVIAVLSACAREARSSIQSDRLRAILKQHETTAVQRAALNYLYEKPELRISPESLRYFLKSTDPEILAFALLIQSKQIGERRSAESFADYLQHPASSVRQATLIAMLSAGVSLPSVSAFDCFAATQHLRRNHYEFGFEGRLANAMERAIAERGSGAAQESQKHIELPLVHLLQRIDTACPGYLEQINRAGSGCFERFCEGLLCVIASERELLQERVILDASTNVVAAMHHEECFTPFYINTLCGESGIGSLSAVKQAGATPFSPPSVPTKPGDSAEIQQLRKKFLKLHDVHMTPRAKDESRSIIARALDSSSGRVTIWLFGHGGFNHCWFSEGLGASVESANLNDSRAISYKDIAQILFESCRTPRGDVECGRVTLFLDACYQYTMAEQLLYQLEELAATSGTTVLSYPVVTSISQPLMRGKIEGIVDKVDQPLIRYFAPRWFSDIRMRLREDQRLTLGDLFSADIEVHHAFDEAVADPMTLRQSAPRETTENWKKPNERGLKSLWGEAPAIFGPNPINIREKLDAVIRQLNEEGPHSMPLVPPNARFPKHSFLEVG